MRVHLGTDHRGFELKTKIKACLEEKGFEVIDHGAEVFVETDDYPDFGFKVGEAVSNEPDSRGIVLCGSGIGVCVAANKVKRVRCGLAWNKEIAGLGRKDDDINVLALPADFVDFDEAIGIVESFLETPFDKEDRFNRRISKIKEYEKN